MKERQKQVIGQLNVIKDRSENKLHRNKVIRVDEKSILNRY